MVVDMFFINMGADDKRMIALGESPCQLHAQAVGLLLGDLTGAKGLPDLIGYHIIPVTFAPGPEFILTLCIRKLVVRDLNITLICRDKAAFIGLFRVLHIVDDFTDRCPYCTPLARVQSHDARRRRVTASFLCSGKASPEAGPMYLLTSCKHDGTFVLNDFFLCFCQIIPTAFDDLIFQISAVCR